MADQRIQSGALPPTDDEPLFHNPVLMRTRDPTQTRWAAPTLAGLFVLIAAAAIAYIGAHPSKPPINHAVATAPPSAPQSGAS